MKVLIGSARHDERNKYIGGVAGDQTQTSVDDYKGEVSLQALDDFVKGRKFYIIRPKQVSHAYAIANNMHKAVNNKNIGYDQGNRLGIIQYGVDSKVKTECDCSSLVRECVKEAINKDPGNFTTANEISKLTATKCFDNPIVYTKNTKVYYGDVFVTQSKGHTGICVVGEPRERFTTSGFTYQGVDYSKVFDPTYYRNIYSDVRNTFGSDEKLLFQHFVVFGMKEKRQAIATFNVEAYAKYNSDVLKACTSKSGVVNWVEVYKHYCVFGYKEEYNGQPRRTI